MTVYVPPVRTLDEVLAGSHPIKARVDIIAGPAVGVSLPVTDGGFTEDALADVCLTGTLTVAGLPEWEPRDAADALDLRSGVELELWLGVRDDVEVDHWWRRGVVAPTSTRVARSGDGLTITVDVADRSHAAKRAGTDRRWVLPRDQSIVSGVLEVLTGTRPTLPVSIPDDGMSAGADLLLAEPGDDVWARARDLLFSVGRDLFVDADGVAVAPLVTSPLTADPSPTAWTGFEVATSDADLCNVVLAPWEEARPDDAPTDWIPRGGTGVATDSTSSTSVTSPLGRIVRLYGGDASVLHSQAHADLAAMSDLVNRVDLQAQASGEVVPDPRRHVRDVVEYDGTRYRITRLEWDLSGQVMGVQLGAARDLAAVLADLTAPSTERRTTEIVTGLDPLRVQRVSGVAGEVIVEWTDALAGVAVGDAITVLHKGMGRRVGVALVTGKTLAVKHAGQTVASIRVGTGTAQPITVGSTTTIPAGASTTHTHRLPLSLTYTVPSTLGSAGSNTPSSGVAYYSWDAANEDRQRINALVNAVSQLKSQLGGSGATTGQPI